MSVTMKKDPQNTKKGPNITFKNVLFLFDKKYGLYLLKRSSIYT